MSDILKKQKIEVIEGLEESAGCLRTESYDRYAEYVDEGIAEITSLRERLAEADECNRRVSDENEKLRLELDMQQATILVPSHKDDQRRIERLNSALVEALDEAALLRNENEKMKYFLRHNVFAEKQFGVYFVCGDSGDKDRNGMPKDIYVCPAYGSDIIYRYKRMDSSAPQW